MSKARIDEVERVMIRSARLAVGIGLALAGVTFGSMAMAAGDSPDGEPSSRIVAKLKALRPDLPIEEVSPAPVPGMVAIELTGGTMLYATEDGRYLFAGDLYAVGDDKLTNLAEEKRNTQRKKLIADVAPSDMAIFSPAKMPPRAVVNVFTDVDCGYCRKLHLEVPRLNELGVEVRYLAFPRGGVSSPGYDKLVVAWCANDRNDAITRLKRGEKVKGKSCENPVAQQYELGIAVGVTGTPALVLEDGTLLPGYLSANDLAEVLGI